MDAAGRAHTRPFLRVPEVISRPRQAARKLGFPGTPYVTHCRSAPSSSNVIAASDDGILHIVDKTNGTEVWTHKWEQGRKVTDLCTATQGWVTSGEAGVVGLWDGRKAGPSNHLSCPHNRPYLSVAAQTAGAGPIVAAGCEMSAGDAYIDIWDLRSPEAPIFSYVESHSDDVTALSFSPYNPTNLLSGAQDGLIAAYDLLIGADEDDAVIAVGNTGASLAKIGWGGAKAGLGKNFVKAGEEDKIDQSDMQIDGEKQANERKGIGCAWAVSDMQTVSIWDADKFDMILSPEDARQPYSVSPPWESDFVIDACDTSAMGISGLEDGVILFTGDPEGGAAIIHIASPSSPTAIPPVWSLLGLLPKSSEVCSGMAHSDIVRCVDFDVSTRTITTGGEDGRICIWSLDGSEIARDEAGRLTAAPIAAPDAIVGSGSVTEGGRDRGSLLAGSGKKRYKPYG
ncbi:WD40 repeat-like protein [Tilletiaria anomala UBC 951]|uniref:WD40 repeat-like protein n=1 Tax=Tilletiaria anomala (strain ATCC 24038 / CBS 436.72 / UBC 951) TaxID=1037660 RepID=A0A066VI16_TILAU|nr:WD40 repeat-like protein [Tilletiaria anomala UBC 951]KDN41156.1 WD40 repeat-like protein [Tilletiaria anomala UBC 951]